MSTQAAAHLRTRTPQDRYLLQTRADSMNLDLMDADGMNAEKWEEIYLLAAVEVDGKKMPDRIAAVREAIRARLQELEQSSNHHAERHRLASTLKILDVLEAESQPRQ